MAIALIDVRVLDFCVRRTPRVHEDFAGKAQERGVAERGSAMAQIDGLPVTEVARGAGADAESQSDVGRRCGGRWRRGEWRRNLARNDSALELFHAAHVGFAGRHDGWAFGPA